MAAVSFVNPLDLVELGYTNLTYCLEVVVYFILLYFTISIGSNYISFSGPKSKNGAGSSVYSTTSARMTPE